LLLFSVFIVVIVEVVVVEGRGGGWSLVTSGIRGG
jgi:hypothetical protein